MRELVFEIMASLSRNKLRTSLTGFAVAWGIFMLIVLLGAGNGIVHTFQANMNTNALNTVSVYPGVTTTAYKGYQEGRYIELDNRDLTTTEEDFQENPEVDRCGNLPAYQEFKVPFGEQDAGRWVVVDATTVQYGREDVRYWNERPTDDQRADVPWGDA